MRILLTHIKLCNLSIILLLVSSQAFAQDWIYTVVEGDNLWNLSELHLDKVTRFEQIRKLNHIRNPKHLQPGSQIRIPLKWIRSNPVPAQVGSLTGEAELKRASDAKSQSLQPGVKMYLGDEIKTGKNTSIAILFADKTILTVYENTLVRFNHLSAHGITGMVDTRLNVLQGRVNTTVTPAVGPGSRFEIQTPSAISAVRGTIYRVSVQEDGETSNIEVLRGKVAVSGDSKQELVNAGFGTQVRPKAAPLPPRALLPAPDFEPIPNTIEQVGTKISWTQVPQASRYRIELSNNANFETLLWQDISQHPFTSLHDISDGRYFLRVRAIDSVGMEGLNQTANIFLNAHPQPPIALKPSDGSVLRGQIPTLQWTGAEQAITYRLQIATDVSFNQLVLDKSDISDTHYTPSEVSVNTVYYWRLFSIANDGEQGPVGPVRSYELKPIPAKVDASISSKEDGKLIASWQASSNEQHYQVQLANDKDFTNLLVDKIVMEPTFSFDPVKKDTRFLRVKSIEMDGYEGPWGATQSISPTPEEVSYWPLVIGTIFTVLVF